MSKYVEHLTEPVPQTQPIQGATGTPQVPNQGGGFSWAVTPWTLLDRFLILGAEGPTYYASEKDHALTCTQGLLTCLALDGKRAVRRIADVSERGLAPKNDAAVFALAVAAAVGTSKTADLATLPGCHPSHLAEVRKDAFDALPKVCRIGTHQLQFVAALDKLRGWGPQARRGVSNWYTRQTPENLVYQLTKYQSRGGWSHKDVLRLTHPKAQDPTTRLAFQWALGKADLAPLGMTDDNTGIMKDMPGSLLMAVEAAKKAASVTQVVRLIREHGLVREHVPTRWLKEAAVWEALLQKMPLTATLRNLGNFTKHGLLTPLSENTKLVCTRLTDPDYLKKSRVHPLNILVALRTYAQGHGHNSDGTWTPNAQVLDAMNPSFYIAFGNVVPSGKRFVVGIDVSMSMAATVGGTPLSACEVATAMALVTLTTEPECVVCAFNNGMQVLPVSKSSRLDDALRHTRNINGGGTDCALPMLWADRQNIPAEAFLVLTDSEINGNSMHPARALQEYRRKRGFDARLVVSAMTANRFSIADPDDPGMLDVAGWSLDVPQLIANFARGDVA